MLPGLDNRSMYQRGMDVNPPALRRCYNRGTMRTGNWPTRDGEQVPLRYLEACYAIPGRMVRRLGRSLWVKADILAAGQGSLLGAYSENPGCAPGREDGAPNHREYWR